MKCKIQWIDEKGAPTPDDNEAIGVAVCWAVDHGERTLLGDGKSIPICAKHAARLKEHHISWPGTAHEIHTHWRLVRF
jgi:hypothetical protein